MTEKLNNLKILLINTHSFKNAGDAALALVTIQQFEEKFPGCKITLSMNDPDSYPEFKSKVNSFFFWSKTRSKRGNGRWNLFQMLQLLFQSLLTALTYRLFRRKVCFHITRKQRLLLESYLRADLIVSVPGNYLVGTGRIGINLLVVCYTIGYAILLGKPLYIYPVSIGPFRHFWEWKLVNWVLTNARIVMVREPASMERLIESGFIHPRKYLIPDIAFSYTGASANTGRNWLTSKGLTLDDNRPLLGITVINWEKQTTNFTNQNEYEISLFEAAKYFIEEMGGKVILFPQVCGPALCDDDRIPARRIYKRLQEEELDAIQVDNPTPPDILKSAYGFMDLFIGTRMHSNIFALSSNVPVIAIAYRYKSNGVMQLLGLDDWIIEIEEINSEKLISLLLNLWNSRNKVKQEISSSMPFIKKECQKSIEVTYNDFILLINKDHFLSCKTY